MIQWVAMELETNMSCCYWSCMVSIVVDLSVLTGWPLAVRGRKEAWNRKDLLLKCSELPAKGSVSIGADFSRG